jgi:hypothetical protein
LKPVPHLHELPSSTLVRHPWPVRRDSTTRLCDKTAVVDAVFTRGGVIAQVNIDAEHASLAAAVVDLDLRLEDAGVDDESGCEAGVGLGGGADLDGLGPVGAVEGGEGGGTVVEAGVVDAIGVVLVEEEDLRVAFGGLPAGGGERGALTDEAWGTESCWRGGGSGVGCCRSCGVCVVVVAVGSLGLLRSYDAASVESADDGADDDEEQQGASDEPPLLLG